jgi:hypothetical protein
MEKLMNTLTDRAKEVVTEDSAKKALVQRIKNYITKYSWSRGSLIAFMDGLLFVNAITEEEGRSILLWAQHTERVVK